MKRGLSGAQVIVRDDFVTKLVTSEASESQRNRLLDQAHWLQRYESPGVPRVFDVRDSSYVMERLSPLPAEVVSTAHLLNAVVNTLRDHVWSRPPVVPYYPDLTQAKVAQLLKKFNLDGLWPVIYSLHGAVRWNRVERVLTHGDPTLDNVMLRSNVDTSDIVLIDPVPASAAVPDLIAVDAGKILQSMLGFEQAVYGDQTPRYLCNLVPDHVRLRLFVRDDNEWRATVFWAVVHLLRTLPYVPVAAIPRVKGLITDATLLV